MKRAHLLVAVIAVAAASARDARGQPSGTAKTAAEELFVEGRKLLDTGHYAEACEKLAKSQALDPSAGTLLNLADCYEKNGQTASAWSAFRGAAKAASDRKRADWEKIATRHAAQLEPKLMMLTITSRADADTEVVCDGTIVERALLGTPVPKDPGSHVVEARARGRRSFRAEVKLERPAQRESIEIAPLASEAAAPIASPPPPPPAHTEEPPPVLDDDRGSTQRTVGIGLGIAGIVGLGVGGLFGALAHGALNDAKSGCATYPKLDAPGCNDPSVSSSNDDAKHFATFSTIGFIAGGALVASGIVVWLTAPRGSHAVAIAPSLDRRLQGLTAVTTF